MPASKRRRAAARARTTTAQPAEPFAPVTAAPTSLASPTPEQARPARARSSTNPDDEPRWNQRGLLVLLLFAFALQLPVGVVIHLTSHTNLLIIDMFFFQPEFVLIACFLAMPLARIVTRQPRSLRLLESLSLGAVYALLALLLATVFVHPATGNVSSTQFIKSLQLSDGLRIAFGDALALVGTVAFFPSVNRILGAPGRRARQRMVQRAAAGSRPGARPGRSTAPKQKR